MSGARSGALPVYRVSSAERAKRVLTDNRWTDEDWASMGPRQRAMVLELAAQIDRAMPPHVESTPAQILAGLWRDAKTRCGTQNYVHLRVSAIEDCARALGLGDEFEREAGR